MSEENFAQTVKNALKKFLSPITTQEGVLEVIWTEEENNVTKAYQKLVDMHESQGSSEEKAIQTKTCLFEMALNILKRYFIHTSKQSLEKLETSQEEAIKLFLNSILRIMN